jgi:hypothetical protein
MDLDKTLYTEIGARAYSALEQEARLPRTTVVKRGIEGLSRYVNTYVLVDNIWFWIDDVGQEKLPEFWLVGVQEDPTPTKQQEGRWLLPIERVDDVIEDWENLAC